MLDALRRAHTAKQRLLSNLPARVETIPLPDLQASLAVKHYKGEPLECMVASFDCSGRWLALVLGSRQYCSLAQQEQEQLRLPFDHCTYAVLLYSTIDGFQEQARFNTASCKPCLQWHQAVPHLGLALQPRLRDRLRLSPTDEVWDELDCSPEHPAAFIWDAGAGAVHRALGQEAAAAVRELDKCALQDLLWSPTNCRFLMVYGQWHEVGPCNDASTGHLTILDLLEDRVAARAELVGTREDLESDFHAVAWHPHHLGFVLSAGVCLRQEDCFRQAGFALGTLPEGLHNSSGFSHDAGHLVAVYLDEDMYGAHSEIPDSHLLVKCSVEGQQICLVRETELPPVCDVQWVPSSFSLLLTVPRDSETPSCIVTGPFTLPTFHVLLEPMRRAPYCRLLRSSLLTKALGACVLWTCSLASRYGMLPAQTQNGTSCPVGCSAKLRARPRFQVRPNAPWPSLTGCRLASAF